MLQPVKLSDLGGTLKNVAKKKNIKQLMKWVKEDNAWALLSIDALKKAWNKEDAIWDKIARGADKSCKERGFLNIKIP